MLNFYKSCDYFVQHSGRIIETSFKTNIGIDLVVINNYTPHSGRSIAERSAHIDLLNKITEENSGKILLIAGDFNTRFHSRNENEKGTLGPHIFGKGHEVMEQIMERDIEGTHNRNLTIDWAMGNDMVCTNTYFEKTYSKLVTFKTKSAPDEYEVWDDNEVFAQIDFIWVNDRWKKAIVNVETDTVSKFPSDHYPLTAEINLKLQEKENQDSKTSGTKWRSVHKPYHKEEVVKK